MSTELREHAEKRIKPRNGMLILILDLLMYVVAIAGIIVTAIMLDGMVIGTVAGTLLIVLCCLHMAVLGPILFCGLKVINPNEALVLVLFGTYYGTIAEEGFFFVNPFCIAIHPANPEPKQVSESAKGTTTDVTLRGPSKKISLKSMTLNNEKQKVNDLEGNPIEIGVIVIWKVVNATKAVLDVDNFKTFVSTQCDSAIRHVARLYPYDVSAEGDEKSLRGSAQEISEILKKELQSRVEVAGIEIAEARISHLAYSPEIAAAMLQRQQASAIIAARQMIVEGAVGMVEMALNKLSDQNIVDLDDERKAQMVCNLLVVLCGNKDAQPIVNSGSIY